MLRTSWLVIALLFACGGGEDSESSQSSSTSTGDEAPVSDDSSDSPPEASNVPSDFSITQAGGPVRRSRDHVERQTTIEPSGGGFALVVRDVGPDGPTEVVRADIDPSDLEPVYQIVVDRREELSGECINPNIRDGNIRRFMVMLEGEELEFRCTNSATPAFEALAEAFDDLAITNTPAH